MSIPFNKPIDKDNPCDRDCPRRTATCHGTCPDYKIYRAGKDEDLREAVARNMAKDTMSDAQKRRIWRGQRYGRNQPLNRSTKER